MDIFNLAAFFTGVLLTLVVYLGLNQFTQKWRAKISVLEQQVEKLYKKIQLLESGHQDLPLPMWLKDPSGTMLAVNIAYEETFLLPRGFTSDDYVGKKDTAVWPAETAKVFAKNDRSVYRSGVIWRGTETMPSAAGDHESWKIIKYVRYSPDGQKIGIAGIAIPINGNG